MSVGGNEIPDLPLLAYAEELECLSCSTLFETGIRNFLLRSLLLLFSSLRLRSLIRKYE